MIINGMEIDKKQLADAVATAYAVIAADPNHEPKEGEIEHLTRAYLTAYRQVTGYDQAFLEALVQNLA